jgi:hypothetical protein
LVLRDALAVEMCMMHARRACLPRLADEEADRDALLDVKDVLITPVWSALALPRVAVQVDDVDVRERLQQAVAHARERRAVHIAVVGDEREDQTV